MKKFLISLVCLMMVGVLSVKAQTAKIILQHGDEATFFASHQLQDAVDAAVDGDVIYLNKGAFSSSNDITVSKRISIIGAGMETQVVNEIQFDNNENLELHSTVFEGFYCSGITINTKVNGLSIRKCSIPYFFFKNNKNTCLSNSRIEQSNIGSITFESSGVGNLSVEFYNCNISFFREDRQTETPGIIVFNNCNIKDARGEQDSSGYGSRPGSSFINCIVHFHIYDDKYFDVLVLKNCLYSVDGLYKFGDSETIDCWQVSNFSNMFEKSVADLTEAGYVCSDGKVVGIHGGTLPFSLEPIRPSVSDFQIAVDPQTRKMTVNLKVNNK